VFSQLNKTTLDIMLMHLAVFQDPVRVGDDDATGIMYFNIASDTAVWVGRVLLWIFTLEAATKVIAFTPW
jgi:hypothetical protein